RDRRLGHRRARPHRRQSRRGRRGRVEDRERDGADRRRQGWRPADDGAGRRRRRRRHPRGFRRSEGGARVKVMALDYGSARTGVAVSDPTGTLARPLSIVEKAGSEAGLAELARLVAEEDAERIVVGLPLTLRGERGEQAVETERFVDALRAVVDVPV